MKNKKKTPLVALAILAVVGVVGGTIAYFTSTETFENLFGTGKYSTTIKENFESPDNWLPGTITDKTVEVTNNGNVPVVVRAKINEDTKGWYNGDTKLSLDENVTVQFTTNSGWTKHTDGYYYYNKILASGAKTTKSFIESVTFSKDAELGETGKSCTYIFTYKDGETSESETDTPLEGKKVISKAKKCETTSDSYAGATYRLDITVETMQADAYQNTDAWGTNTPSITEVQNS